MLYLSSSLSYCSDVVEATDLRLCLFSMEHLVLLRSEKWYVSGRVIALLHPQVTQ